ncbi:MULTISPECIES: AAA family ATPase [Spirulina sp. CCY15215]|uniref:AAA family ATPase n=1 Tax=Spirulina sp. CCY15215 TaxID=2767591 RepID=UPI00195113CF
MTDHKPWEMIGEMWYPYVQIVIDPKVTTVVGANESGKSHLLSAIEKAISGEHIKRQDFCRYSQFFTVREGKLKFPDFGSEWSNLSQEEEKNIRSIAKIPEEIAFDRFFLFRGNKDNLKIYLLGKNKKYNGYDLSQKNTNISNILPHPFIIYSDIALPQSVPIRQIIKCHKQKANGTKWEFLERSQKLKINNLLETLSKDFGATLKSNGATTLNNQPLNKLILSLVTAFEEDYGMNPKDIDKRKKEFELAYKLICQVAQIDAETLEELATALTEGNEGYVQGLLAKVNAQLSDSLNFPSWWVQDRDFRLCVSARDHDLVFTIRDRTGTEYSFAERSSGLKYFLSYYIQYRAHQPHQTTSEILLMDEPDTYLSSQAQQDLLKIFEAFANGEDEKPPVQVVYVTHSPFLIDKNHSQRIRVLEKSKEGTRVVKDAAKNHYEPLRSAFGAFVGETAFIGNCNLIVEGNSDQILIAGAATYLRSLNNVSELENLDLNHVTIVPVGGASHVPYLVYLARGRDVEQPPVVVLLDSDKSGNDAKKDLKKGGFLKKKELLKEKFVLQIGDLAKDKQLKLPEEIKDFKLIEIEDLIPVPICVEAAKLYAREDCKADSDFIDKITEHNVLSYLNNGKQIFDGIQNCFRDLSEGEFHIQKVGFARNVVGALNKFSKQKSDQNNLADAIQNFEINFKILFRRIDEMRRNAEREESNEKFSQKMERRKNQFLNDHPVSANREDAIVFLDDLDSMLDDSSPKSDEIRHSLQNLKRDYKLDTEMVKPVDNYPQFREALDRIKYAGKIASQENDG